ncbi:WD40 repeat domain-containing protein [Dyadobacter endophyticus]|uniref:WD40 repeat domain-containing protein n=1 Tax=Dyadobacter endophyticus TaxID=1749036 RepID=UPI003CE738CE
MHTSEIKIDLPAAPYRGVKPFRYLDRNIFSAREWEKDKLLRLVFLYRGSLLYGTSGIGKSSLVNAGLVPQLLESNFQPEIVRIYPDRKGAFCIYKIRNSKHEEEYFPSIFDTCTTEKNEGSVLTISFDSFKKCVFSGIISENGADESRSNTKIPVIIFDQFEEFITLFEDRRSNRNKLLASANDNKIFQAELINFFRECYYNKELSVKFLFSFREDYLANLSKLFRAIPDLRDHSLRIKAIDKGDLEKIIKCPFSENERRLYYQNSLTEKDTNLLTRKFHDFFSDKEPNLTDVQIVCQYVFETDPLERKVLFEKDGQEINNSIEIIIEKFYDQQLRSFAPAEKNIATSILSLLVLNEHTRNLYHFDAIIEELEDQYQRETIVTVLQALDSETRLIRSESRPGGIYYEINSESLIPYIDRLKIENEQEKIRKIEKKARVDAENKARSMRNKRILAVALISLFAALTFWYFFSIKQQQIYNEQSKYVFASGANKYTNPTLSYIIAQKGISIGNRNLELENISNSFLNSKNYYITSMFAFPKNIIDAFFLENKICIIQDNSIDYFDKNGLQIDQKLIHGIKYADHDRGFLIAKENDGDIYLEARLISKSAFGKNLLIYLESEGIRLTKYKILNLNGETRANFIYWGEPSTVDISPDGKKLIVDGYIYDVGKLYPRAKVNTDEKFKDLMAAKFTADNKHILTGFWSGHVIVNDLNGKWIKGFKAGSFNSVVTSLAACVSAKYLVVGGRKNNLRFFELGDINTPGKDFLTFGQIGEKSKTIYLENENTNGQINDVILSPTDKTFLSVADDKSGSVWNFQGTKEGFLYGHKESIVSGSFSQDGRQILTWTSSGRVCIWQQGDIDSTYQNKGLAKFSPFDYRVSGLDNMSLTDIYPDINSSPDQKLSAGLIYLASLPRSGYHLEDRGYQNNIKKSLAELSKIFVDLIEMDTGISFSRLNKKLLYNAYGRFRQDSLDIVCGVPHADTTVYIRLLDEIKWESKALEVDTLDIHSAIALNKTYNFIASSLAHSEMPDGHNHAVRALNYAISFTEFFIEKYPEDKSLNSQLATFYGNMSWNSLFVKDYHISLSTAEKGLTMGKQFDWIYTNLALSYLLLGKFSEAENIYRTFKNKNMSNGDGTFRRAFLDDIDELIKAKIIDLQNERLSEEVGRVKIILNTR